MNNTIAKPAAQALDNQRKAARVFHRACVAEGNKNLRQAASMHLPMALLADFPLAIGLAMDMAAKMASPKELDRLRELGRAQLSAMGIAAIEEERVHVDVVLDTIPGPEDAKRLVALGLKRVRKDVGGRRFAGTASPLQVSALVTRIGGRVAVLDEADRAAGSGADGQLGVAQTGDTPASETTLAVSEEPTIAIVSESHAGIVPPDTPSAEDATSKGSPVPMPVPRLAPRFPVPPRLGVPDERRNSISSTSHFGNEPGSAFGGGGARGDVTKPTTPE